MTIRNAVITGSTSGIGLGIAQGFAEAGFNVMINGLGVAEDIEKIRADLAAKGITCTYHPADMTKPDEIAAMMAEAEQTFGQVDVLVNNAGIQNVQPVEEFDPAKWDAIIAINLSSSFHTTRAALPGMKQRDWGRIINIASVHGLVASPFKTAYNSAKHGLVGFTRTVAMEVAQTGVTVNAICPGFVRTALVEKQIDDLATQHGLSKDDTIRDIMLPAQPTRRFTTVEQIAGAALFLC